MMLLDLGVYKKTRKEMWKGISRPLPTGLDFQIYLLVFEFETPSKKNEWRKKENQLPFTCVVAYSVLTKHRQYSNWKTVWCDITSQGKRIDPSPQDTLL